MEALILSCLRRAMSGTVTLVAVEKVVLLMARVRHPWQPSPRCGAYGETMFFHLFLKVVNMFRVWMTGEGLE